MDDLSATINQVLSSEEGKKQLQAMASMLTGSSPEQNSASNQGSPAQQGNSGGLDFSKLGEMLSQMSAPSSPAAPASGGESPGSGDLSGLAQMLSGVLGGASPAAQPASAQASSGPDLSSLMKMLGGGTPAAGGTSAPALDMNSLMNLQKIFSSFNREDENILLLRALKPHLKDRNQKKVDDAIRIMQLISVLPLIKESGLFGGSLF